MDLKFATNLPAPKCDDKPGMRLATTPIKTASLALPESETNEEMGSRSRQADPIRGGDPASAKEDSAALLPGTLFHNFLRRTVQTVGGVARNESARSLGVAYDSLHRIQAILAYLHIMRHRVPGIGQFLDEAKHTYEQSLARFAAGDFNGAREYADASGSLSRVVEIIMTRTLRSDTSLGSIVPPPPKYPDAEPEPGQIEEDLAQTETVLSKIHWLLEFGTLPTDERAQVRKLASWGDAFYKQAQRTYRNALLEDAAEFARAALAGANSAEHVCRKWYVSPPVQP